MVGKPVHVMYHRAQQLALPETCPTHAWDRGRHWGLSPGQVQGNTDGMHGVAITHMPFPKQKIPMGRRVSPMFHVNRQAAGVIRPQEGGR